MRVKCKWNEFNSFQVKQSELNMFLNPEGALKIIDKYFITNYKIPSASFLYRKKKLYAVSFACIEIKSKMTVGQTEPYLSYILF